MPPTNRRNYYRVLYVQPEAPVEVIKASYRALMGTLRRHPDLGGDHDQAVLLNEAYAALTDPARRAAYDAVYSVRRLRTGSGGAQAPSTAAAAPEQEAPLLACPVCTEALPPRVTRDTRCRTCGSPLALPPRSAGSGQELFGRRGSARRDKNHSAVMRLGWPGKEWPVRWRDLSLSGLSVFTPQPVRPGAVIRVLDPALDAVARVVSCRASGPAYAVHAHMITADFLHLSRNAGGA